MAASSIYHFTFGKCDMVQNKPTKAISHCLDVHAAEATSASQNRQVHITAFSECGMCQQSIETQEHLFFECKYAKDI